MERADKINRADPVWGGIFLFLVHLSSVNPVFILILTIPIPAVSLSQNSLFICEWVLVQFPLLTCLCVIFFFFFFFSSSQLKQPLFSEKTPRPLFGACRHAPCKACWTLTTYAPGKNPLWQPWSTPSRRLRYFPLN